MPKLEEIIAKVLDIDSQIVTDATAPENVESWDSFNSLMLAAEIEKVFTVNLSIEEIASMKSVGDIKKILHNHGIPV